MRINTQQRQLTVPFSDERGHFHNSSFQEAIKALFHVTQRTPWPFHWLSLVTSHQMLYPLKLEEKGAKIIGYPSCAPLVVNVASMWMWLLEGIDMEGKIWVLYPAHAKRLKAACDLLKIAICSWLLYGYKPIKREWAFPCRTSCISIMMILI